MGEPPSQLPRRAQAEALDDSSKPGTKRFETALPLTISFPLRAESEAAAHHRRRKRQIDIEPSFPVVMATEYRIRRYRNADGTISRLRESLRGVDRT